MASCCESSDPPLVRHAGAELVIALAGNPNSGKTTIFNDLTGLHQKVANYAGVTVDKKIGRCKLPDGSHAQVLDLPGTYSLISRSPDEQVAMEVLRGLRPDTPAPDLVIAIVDASNLQRNLYLVSQLIELGRPMVVALNMMDVAQRRGLNVSPERLEKELGVPVVPVVGHKRQGIDQLKQAIARAAVAPLPAWVMPDAMREELMLVGGGLAILDNQPSPRPLDRCRAIAERLLIGDRAADLGELAAREPVNSLLTAASARLAQLGIDPMQVDIEAHYHWIESVASRVSGPIATAPTDSVPSEPVNLSRRVDSILIHKVWGLLIFALIMAVLFVTIFWVADPIMKFLQNSVSALGVACVAHLADGALKDLIRDGIFAGVGTIIVFVPQIAFLFFFLAILEDTGYLARAAFLMDRLLAKTGLHGKSFIPLLSSFACAIPGIMATRTIESRKDRLATILVAPFMSCSARLPVYALLIGTFFAASSAISRASIMLGLYALGIVAAAGTAWCFKRTLLKGPAAAFILELPTYKFPQVSQILRQMWTNTSAFLTKAGTTIFCLSVLLWGLSYFPRMGSRPAQQVQQQARVTYAASGGNATGQQDYLDNALASAQVRQSVAGRIGRAMEPIIKPLGFDWKMGIGLVGAFAAREVFVSTMGIIYSVGDPEEHGGSANLSAAMVRDKYADGRPVWSPLVAISLLVWFVLALQCMSTVAIVRRETGGWTWPIFMIIYMNGLAYVASLLVFQIGRHLI